MSLTEIRNVVLLFSNPVWSGASTVPSTIIRNLTALSSQLAYEERLDTNLTTLTTTNADTLDGVIQGLLYVPDLDNNEACDKQQYDFIPKNVTRRANLPPTNYNLIALAPWFSIDCTLSYLASARTDPIRAFVFYKPNNSSNKPQDSDSPVWNLEDGGAWVKTNKYPIFAISGKEGHNMMQALSLYSGSISEIPHGSEINSLYGPNPKDYVRVWAELTLENDSNIPPLWAFFLIVIGALLVVILGVSCTMHLIQRRRRISLQRRVQSGEVDLEAMGIKRLTVPTTHINEFPLFTYNADPESMGPPQTPVSTRVPRNSRRQDQYSSMGSATSVRSKRCSIGRATDTTATNHQPSCHICLANFEHRRTIIKELTCGHIFHPECIDEFLSQNSSLCPMCKHSMLPRGYSPKITNGMVRRERALRRLRERVDLDDLSQGSRDSKLKGWGKRLFRSPTSSAPATRLVPVNSKKLKQERPRESTPMVDEEQGVATTDTTPASASGSNLEDSPPNTAIPAPAKTVKTRRTRPRALSLLPTQPEDSEPSSAATADAAATVTATAPVGRTSPSSFARERMREIAARNAPFDDPDQQRALWRRGLAKVFPGYF